MMGDKKRGARIKNRICDVIPQNAILCADKLPDPHEKVLAWVKDDVLPGYQVVVCWNDVSHAGVQWWFGIPGKYTRLRDGDWAVLAWIPLLAASSPASSVKGTEGKADG